jgi:hypothetical protein
MAKLPTNEEVDAATAAFKPYFTALGEVAHAWNHLQEEFAHLFCIVAGLDNSMGSAIWHSLVSDRAQREMVRAAVNVAASDEDWVKKFPQVRGDIEWALDKADCIAERRNRAIHAPCSVGIGAGDFEIIPWSFFGNRLAKKLVGKDVLHEFKWYEESANTLKQFVREAHVALFNGRSPWPDKPRMPTVQRKNNPQDHPPRPRQPK